MIGIINRLDDYSGYKLVKEEKKINLKIYSFKEEGQRLVSIKFDVQRAKIPMFNLLSMIYETDLYDLWFPFTQRSYDYTQLGKASKIAFQEMFMPFPLANRECIMYGKGANRIYHNGTILVTA